MVKMTEISDQQLALLMVRQVTDAMERGTQHYDRAGNLLTTPLEVVDCLEREGGFYAAAPLTAVRRIDHVKAAMQLVYTLVIGVVAASMISVVYRFEPNRALARVLIAIVCLTGTLAILANLN